MKLMYNQAVQKIKRKDFLDDVVREKTAEDKALNQELTGLRKTNGKGAGVDNDLKIVQINAKRADIDKLVTKCKAEIKTLKADILELLSQCYAMTDSPEIISKINSATYHAFDGKIKLVSDKEAGGIMGDCDIVGAIVTHDKTKKNTTAQLVKAGVASSNGVITKRPAIFVYDYDKKQEEGIFHPETNSFRIKIKQKKQNPVAKYLKQVYGNINTVYSLCFALIFAIFSVWTAIGGFGNSFGEIQLRYSAVIGFFLGAYTLATLKKSKRGGLADTIPLTALLVSIVSFACAFARGGWRAFIFPTVTFTYSVVALVLRATSKKDDQTEERGYVISVALGVILAFTFRYMSSVGVAYRVTAMAIFGGLSAVGAVLSIIKRNDGVSKIAGGLAIFGSVFCLTCIMLIPKPIPTVIFGSVGAVLGLCPIVARWVK